jgi:hypothetical protein
MLTVFHVAARLYRLQELEDEDKRSEFPFLPTEVLHIILSFSTTHDLGGCGD